MGDRDATFELVDIADYHLPLLDDSLPPVLGRYSYEHTKRWSAKIASFICGTRGARPVSFGDVPFAGVSCIRSKGGCKR